MDSYMEFQPLFQRRPLGSFSGTSVTPCSSEGSQMFGLGSSKSPDAHVSFQQPMAHAEGVDQGTSGGSCGFRRLVVDDCARIRLFLMADEHFLLQRDPADSSPVYCIICRENFGDAHNMLRHLRNCKALDKGEYLCPTCNTWEQVRTSSKKKPSRLRTRLGSKIRKGYEQALKRLLGPKQTLCSNCRCKIEAAERSFSSHTTKPSWASLGEEGLTASHFPASSAQHCNKAQPARRYSVQQSPSWLELADTPHRVELYDTSPLSELRGTNPVDAEVYPYAMDGPQVPSFNIPQGIPEIDSHAVNFGAFPGRANEQTFPMSSNPPYASAKRSSLAPYDTSPTELTSVAPTHTSHTAFSVSPTSSTDSGSGGSSCQAHPSPEKSFSTNPDHFETESLNGMPTAFTSHPAVSMDSFQETSWNPVIADMRPSSSLAIDTSFMNTYAPSSTWGPQHSYLATPTMVSFQNPPARAASNPFNRAPKPNTTVTEKGSLVSAQSSLSTSPSSSQSPSPSSATATASPTSDASGPASMDEAGAGPLQCADCDFRPSGKNTASYPAYLRKHRQSHAPCLVTCDECGANFTRHDNLNTHIKTAHGARRKRTGSNGMSPPDLRRKKPRGPEAGEP